jgi:4-amino-4-deoxy-L-arabinose transferase-like glycosyltransferase
MNLRDAIRLIMQKRPTTIFWILGITLGIIYALANRNYMSPDGICYLNVGDALFRGDWHSAINALWSPLYGWILGLAIFLFKPSISREFPVVQLVNLCIYTCALACFTFFMDNLLNYHQTQVALENEQDAIGLPRWAIMGIGYALFGEASLILIRSYHVTPDMCVAALVYLICGLLVRIRMGSHGWQIFAALGILLGLGYLAKTVMFPLAFVFIIVGMFAVGNIKKGFLLSIIATLCFAVIAAPLILALSRDKGRMTIGDSAKLNYVWHVNLVLPFFVHWQGGPTGSGSPKHPTRILFEKPRVYEFSGPVRGTYPPYQDPSYWYDGVKVRFSLKDQINAIVRSLRDYYTIVYEPQVGLISGILIFCLLSERGWRFFKGILRQWFILLPALVAFVMYLLVAVFGRYIGMFIVLFWMGILTGIRMADSLSSIKQIRAVCTVMILLIVIPIAVSTAGALWSLALDVHRGPSVPSDQQVAFGLRDLGMQPGDKVALLGCEFCPYWARLCRLTVVAELPYSDRLDFWSAKKNLKDQILDAIAKAGAKAVIAREIPALETDVAWHQIGTTDYHVLMLNR